MYVGKLLGSVGADEGGPEFPAATRVSITSGMGRCGTIFYDVWCTAAYSRPPSGTTRLGF